MIAMLLFAALALADSSDPYDGGFVSQPRDDVPIDARLLYAASFLPEATVLFGPGAPLALEVRHLTGGVGTPPRVLVLPPAGGWQAGATYTVEVAGYEGSTPGDVLTFTVGEASATGPADFAAAGVRTTAWSEPDHYPWGCCEPTRTVEIPVTVGDADPWSYVEIIGHFEGPSQITEYPFHTHLDVATGPGEHALSFTQWQKGGVAVPQCFDVVAVSAAGLVGQIETFCTDDAGDAATGCGCATGSGGVGWLSLALALGAGRRRFERTTAHRLRARSTASSRARRR